MGMVHWTMGHFDSSTCCPMGQYEFPWSCSSGPWDVSNVQPLSHGPLCIAHGPFFCCVTSVPWAWCIGPWDILTFQPVSHEPLCIPHGPVCSCPKSVPGACCIGTMGHFDNPTCCPMGHYASPMVLSCSMTPVPWACSHGSWDVSKSSTFSHGPLCNAHGPCFFCVTSITWAWCIGPWDILIAQPVSHGPLCISHGHVPVVHGMFQLFNLCPMGHYALPWCFMTSVPQACFSGPWDVSNVHPLSHGPLCIAHGPFFCCVTSVPWDILTVQPVSHGPLCIPHGLPLPVLHLSHGHAGMDHGTFQMFNLCPMGLPGPS
jgi:hypothetical protein